MSSSDFEMPRVIGNGPARAIEEALANPTPPTPYPPYPPPRQSTQSYTPPKTQTHSDAIKDRLKQLTHREMRDFVGEIFDAHRKLRTERTSPLANAASVEEGIGAITISQLPDVFDKLAYGD